MTGNTKARIWTKEVKPMIFKRVAGQAARPEEAPQPVLPPPVTPALKEVQSFDYSTPPAEPGKSAYAAFTEEPVKRRVPTRLYIQFADGQVQEPSYPFLVDVLYSSPQRITLIFTHLAIDLRGENLDQLLRPLQEHKVKDIFCFNGKKHVRPDKKLPIITGMKRKSMQDALKEDQPDGKQRAKPQLEPEAQAR